MGRSFGILDILFLDEKSRRESFCGSVSKHSRKVLIGTIDYATRQLLSRE